MCLKINVNENSKCDLLDKTFVLFFFHDKQRYFNRDVKYKNENFEHCQIEIRNGWFTHLPYNHVCYAFALCLFLSLSYD